MAYKGNKEYKLDCNCKLWLYITGDCRYEPYYDKETMRYINRHRRMRDKREVENYLREVIYNGYRKT